MKNLDPEIRNQKRESTPLPLFEQAHARKTDPINSHLAAVRVTNLGRVRDAIIAILEHFGPKSDEEIKELYKIREVTKGYPWASEESLRTRRSELVRMGFVREVGTGRTQAGRACGIWGLCGEEVESDIEQARRQS